MKRILVVEDEDVIRDFEVINLKRSGYEVVDVPSGEEALQIFDRNPAYFDVAVLDVMMPGIDGFEVCRRIREKNSSIGIIMLTAKSQEMDKVNGLMIGADDYVTKPFSPALPPRRHGRRKGRRARAQRDQIGALCPQYQEPYRLEERQDP